MVREWYRATAAWMQLKEDHDKLHLDRARAAVSVGPRHPVSQRLPARDLRRPADPDRGAIGDAADRGDARRRIRAHRAARGGGAVPARARDQAGFRRGAAALRPRARSARQACGGGRRTAPGDRRASPIGRCCTTPSMFLGAEEEALGNRDAARVAYEQSAELYPMAQSPLAGAQPAGAPLRRSPRRAARDRSPVRAAGRRAQREGRSVVVVLRRAGRATPTMLLDGDAAAVSDGACCSEAARSLALAALALFECAGARAAEPGLLVEGRSGARRRAGHRQRPAGPRPRRRPTSRSLDNGVPQQVDLVSFDEIPLNVILALDMSDSVAGERLEQLRGAGGRAARRRCTKSDQAALVSFSHAVQLGAKLTDDVARGARRARRVAAAPA